MNIQKPLLITTGEPAGIGMDIVLQLAANQQLNSSLNPHLDTQADTLNKTADKAKHNEHIEHNKRSVWVTADANALSHRAEQLQAAEKIAGTTVTTATFLKPTWTVISQAEAETLLLNSASSTLSPADAERLAALVSADFVVIDIPCAAPVEAGVINPDNAAMVLAQLALAHRLAAAHAIAAIVTGPLQKSALIEAGIRLADGSMFSGHTEYFMQQAGCDKVVMMLANNTMKVALVTTHLPLKDVAAAITKDNVTKTVDIVLADLITKFGLAAPKVLVCGLNPHAGEGGHLGMEEIHIINPVLKSFQQQGVDISDAMPADTLFTQRHLQECDAVIAMYHDQGLPVLKSHGFGDTVNLTLGLPYIRTSVDHGTALDLAGTGKASASSLYQALMMAEAMSAAQAQ